MLSKVIIRKQYPLPIIPDMLDQIPGYKFFTKLDISMQYYTFELDKPSHELCVIVTSFGKYKYKCLPMGLTFAKVLCDVKDTGVYLDNIGAFSFPWEHHMLLLDKILHHLEANGFTVNPTWAIQETDWLGYWLLPTGLKPWHKKQWHFTNAMTKKSFANMRFLCCCQSLPTYVASTSTHPCTSFLQVGKENFNWTPEMDLTFKCMKALMEQYCLLPNPIHNKPFHIYTDTFRYQIEPTLSKMTNWKPSGLAN